MMSPYLLGGGYKEIVLRRLVAAGHISDSANRAVRRVRRVRRVASYRWLLVDGKLVI